MQIIKTASLQGSKRRARRLKGKRLKRNYDLSQANVRTDLDAVTAVLSGSGPTSLNKLDSTALFNFLTKIINRKKLLKYQRERTFWSQTGAGSFQR